MLKRELVLAENFLDDLTAINNANGASRSTHIFLVCIDFQAMTNRS